MTTFPSDEGAELTGRGVEGDLDAASSSLPDPEPVEVSPAAAEFALHLLSLRAAVRVGMALALAMPDEDAVDRFFNRPDVVEALDAFGEVRDDIAMLSVGPNGLDEGALALAVRNHRGRGLEALEYLAEELMVPVDDLVSVLLRA